MILRRLSPVLILSTALLLSGCFVWTTSKEGDALNASVADLQKQLQAMESRQATTEKEMADMVIKAQAEIDTLNETLTKATRVLARNSADFGSEMEGIKDQIMASQGTFAELQHAIETLQKDMLSSSQRLTEFALAAGLDIPLDEAKVPASESDHLAAIRASMSAGRYGESRSLVKIFQKRYPTSKSADEVQLIMARSFIAQKRHANALGALRLFVDTYPKSPLMPEVLYEMANSFFKLGDCTDARILIDTLSSRHKDSPFVQKAQALLTTINEQKARCTS